MEPKETQSAELVVSKNVIRRLFESRKVAIATLTIVAVALLVGFGRATFEQFFEVLKWLSTATIASIAAEDVASKLPANGGEK